MISFNGKDMYEEYGCIATMFFLKRPSLVLRSKDVSGCFALKIIRFGETENVTVRND